MNDFLERIVREFGPVTIHHVPENGSPDQADDMPWMISMARSRKIVNRCGVHGLDFDPGCGPCHTVAANPTIDWVDHEHGRTLADTAEALLNLLTLRKDPGPG